MSKRLLASFDTYANDGYDWDDFMQDVQYIIMSQLATSDYFAYGLSLTWRNVAGFTSFTTTSPNTLVSKLAPNTGDYRIEFYRTGRKSIIEVISYHHDKPTGETMYLMSQKTAEKKQILKLHFKR